MRLPAVPERLGARLLRRPRPVGELDVTGSRTRRGGISKTGGSHLRRALVEAASAYSRPCRGASAPEDPRVPALVRARAAECSRRLRRRREHLVGRGLAANKVKVAVARELCEWIWWIAVMPE